MMQDCPCVRLGQPTPVQQSGDPWKLPAGWVWLDFWAERGATCTIVPRWIIHQEGDRDSEIWVGLDGRDKSPGCRNYPELAKLIRKRNNLPDG